MDREVIRGDNLSLFSNKCWKKFDSYFDTLVIFNLAVLLSHDPSVGSYS